MQYLKYYIFRMVVMAPAVRPELETSLKHSTQNILGGDLVNHISRLCPYLQVGHYSLG